MSRNSVLLLALCVPFTVAPLQAEPAPATALTPRTDRYGDPLPPDARERLGTLRFRHPGGINALAFAPDGKTLVSAGQTIELWDVATGRALRRWKQAASSLAFTPDGKSLVYGFVGKVVRWEMPGGKIIHDYSGYDVLEYAIALSGDGRTLFAGCDDQTIRRWELATGKELPRLRGLPAEVRALAVAPDGRRLALVGVDNAVRLWDAVSGKQIRRLTKDTKAIYSVAFSPDGRTVTSGSADGVVRLWDAATGKEIRRLGPFASRLSVVLFAPDGKMLATGGGDGVRLWDPRTGKELPRVACRRWFWPRVMAFSPDGKTLAASEGNCGIHLWELASGKERLLDGHEGPVASLHFVASGKYLWSGPADGLLGDGDNTLRLWDLHTGNERLVLRDGPRWYLTCRAFAADGKTVAAGGWDNEGSPRLWVWDGDSGKHLRRIEEPQQIMEVALSSDGRTLAIWAAEPFHDEVAEVRLRDVRTGKVCSRFRLPAKLNIHQLAWLPGGKHLATLSSEAGVCLREAATGKIVRTFRDPDGESVSAFAFSADGASLAVDCGEGGTALIRIWDVAGGRERIRFEVPFTVREETSAIGATLAFSPDGRTLAVGTWEAGISLWEVATGKGRRRYTGHGAPVRSAAFAPDGRTLATGSEDCTICLWDLPGRAAREPVEGLWRRLAEDDAEKAYQAMWNLVAAPAQTVSLLKGRLRPLVPVAEKRLNRLIADLNDEEIAVREEAAGKLVRLGDLAEPALRAELARTKSPEVRQRIRGLLRRLGRTASGDRLRDLRATEALEYIGTPEARQLLEVLAKGGPAARLTQEAKASLRRLKRRGGSKR